MLGTSNPAKAKIRGANYNFSFSGLKTSVLYYLRDNPKANKSDVAASFQQAVIDVLTKKTIRAAQEFKAKSVLLCGGVSANKLLRETLAVETKKINSYGCFRVPRVKGEGCSFRVPDFEYNTDNAAMIAAAAYINLLQKKKERLLVVANGNLTI